MGRKIRDKRLIWILLLFAVLGCLGITWGLPTDGRNWEHHSPAPDVPLDILTDFTGFRYVAYSPAHPMILLAAYAPILIHGVATGDISLDFKNHTHNYADPMRTKTVLILIARLLSLLFALGIIVVLYDIAADLLNDKTALFACLILALFPPFVFLAHTSTVNICGLFFGVLTLYFFLRCLRAGKLSAYILTGVFAALAVAVKEYMYAFALPIPFVLLYDLWAAKKPGKLLRIAAFSLPAIIVFLFFTGLAFNPGNFLFHLGYYAGGATFPTPGLSIGNFFGSFLATIGIGVQTFGIWIFGLCVVGLVLHLRKPRPLVFSVLILPMLSYFIFFLCIYNRVIYRYALFIYVLLPIFGADLIVKRLLQPKKKFRSVAVALLVVVLAASFLKCVAVDLDFIKDPRYDVETWLSKYLAPDSVVEIMDDDYNLPRSHFNGYQYQFTPLGPEPGKWTGEKLDERNPALILVNSYMLENVLYETDDTITVDNPKKKYLVHLFKGDFGYRLAAEFLPPAFYEKIVFYNLNQTFYALVRKDLSTNSPALKAGFIGDLGKQYRERHTYSIDLKNGYTRMESWRAASFLPSGKAPKAALPHACAAQADGKTYSLGGEAKWKFLSYTSSDIFLLDPATGNWQRAGRLPFPVQEATCQAQGETILFSGGKSDRLGNFFFQLRNLGLRRDPHSYVYRP